MSPPFAPAETKQIVETIATTDPPTHDLPGRGWTLKKLQHWVSKRLARTVSRLTHTMLPAAGLSWKKCKKWLGKRDPHKRAVFLDRFLTVYEQVVNQEIVLLYIDESHFHRDLGIGYSWGPVGERLWCRSDCPGLAERINWYGACNFSDGQRFIWAEGACNKENTAAFLHRVDEWVGGSLWCGMESRGTRPNSSSRRPATWDRVDPAAGIQSGPESNRGTLEMDANGGDATLL